MKVAVSLLPSQDNVVGLHCDAVPSCVTHFSVILCPAVRTLSDKTFSSLTMHAACSASSQPPSFHALITPNEPKSQSCSPLCRIFHPLRPKHSPQHPHSVTPHKKHSHRSPVTYSHLSPYLRCAVGLAVLGSSGLRLTGPQHLPELTQYQANCLDRRQIKISELLGYIRLPFSLECADELITHVSSFSFLEFIVFEWLTSFVNFGICAGLKAIKIIFITVFVFVIKIWFIWKRDEIIWYMAAWLLLFGAEWRNKNCLVSCVRR